MTEAMLENGRESCDCPKRRCERHGMCAECIEYHSRKGRLPYCKREKSLLRRLLHRLA